MESVTYLQLNNITCFLPFFLPLLSHRNSSPFGWLLSLLTPAALLRFFVIPFSPVIPLLLTGKMRWEKWGFPLFLYAWLFEQTPWRSRPCVNPTQLGLVRFTPVSTSNGESERHAGDGKRHRNDPGSSRSSLLKQFMFRSTLTHCLSRYWSMYSTLTLI